MIRCSLLQFTLADSGEELSKAKRQTIDTLILKLQSLGEQQVTGT